ncbi:co-chaperone GrpE [gamma proteobacterium HTCC5015]|nr:co-chaperone GrpE [gamma proteobacterium HTCC5015]
MTEQESKQPEAVAETDTDQVEADQVDAVEATEDASAESAVEAEAPTVEALEEAQKKAEENYDLALRTKAEMENLKRRTEKDIDSARKFALEKIANELLGVRDSMEMGLDAAQSDDVDIAKLREGSELTLKMLSSLMEKFNIEPVDPTGEKFNPDFHQAMQMIESEEHEPNTVINVLQKGYTLNGRLLRPALVMVAKAQ